MVLEHFGFKELTKQGWTPGRPLQIKKPTRGLVNPIQQQGFNTEIMFRTNREQLYQHGMQDYPKDDPHYPEQRCRPGLGSRPKNIDDKDPGFDITTRTDQSKIHFPDSSKIRLNKGAAVTKDQLKLLKCRMNPTCDSKRRGFRQRKSDLCDICQKKSLHCHCTALNVSVQV